MIRGGLFILVVVVGVAGTALAADPHDGVVAQLKTTWVLATPGQEPEPGSKAAFYPAAARKSGLEGVAVLRCAIQPDGRFQTCTVVEEEPGGAGFGSAAVAMAQRIQQPVPDSKGQPKSSGFAIVPFFFGIETPVRKDFAQQIAWEQRPGDADMLKARPDFHVGWAIVACTLQADGGLANCHGVEETPWGWGFKRAALALAPKFKAKTILKDGTPLPVGRTIRIPMVWTEAPPPKKSR